MSHYATSAADASPLRPGLAAWLVAYMHVAQSFMDLP
jgi:hypothetical protein